MADRSGLTRDLLVHGIAAAKAGDTRDARRYLERFLSLGPDLKEKIDALYYLHVITEEPAEKRKILEEILAWDPTDGRARRDLAVLNGDLDVNKIIDPDRLAAQPGQLVKAEETDRFTCPQCGGRLTFAPDGQSLTCEYCEAQNFAASQSSPVEEESFVLALATARGHSQAVNSRVVHCGGCGATFLVPPQHLAWQCPYCQSNYAIAQVEERAIVQPNGLIPFAVDEEQAKLRIKRYLRQALESAEGRLEDLQGVYLPMWTFDIGGFLSWQAEIEQNNRWQKKTGERGIYYDDLRVTASKKYPELLQDLFASFDLSALVPFDERYLANWLAESYEITAGDAALVAREKALKLEGERIRQNQLRPIRELTMNSSRMTVDQYKLVLLPTWIAQVALGSKHFPILVNGQNNRLFAEYKRKRKPGNWFSRFFGLQD